MVSGKNPPEKSPLWEIRGRGRGRLGIKLGLGSVGGFLPVPNRTKKTFFPRTKYISEENIGFEIEGIWTTNFDYITFYWILTGNLLGSDL